MRAKHATQIRRGIRLARSGVDLNYGAEEPATIAAYIRTATTQQEAANDLE